MNRSTPLAHPLQVGGVTIPNRVFLAPLSGITDRPFRMRAHGHGAGLVVSEMIASGGLVAGHAESLRRMLSAGRQIHVVQLAGREATHLAEAARIAEGEGADIIDINMGCPAKKVTGGYSGSALMRDLDYAVSLIEAVVTAVGVPVTLKMRLGWDENALNAPALARRAEQAGVSMVTVHGRTRCQFYEGKADWRAIRRVKDAVAIPVVANGDIRTAQDAIAVLEQSGADAVMIGRGHCGAPWAAGEIALGSRAPGIPTDEGGLAEYVIAHYEDMLAHYGTHSGLRQARKHLGWYLDRHAPAAPAALRQRVMTSFDAAEVIRFLPEIFRSADAPGEREAA
jgi:tRNA-dihydrouridine synthase B